MCKWAEVFRYLTVVFLLEHINIFPLIWVAPPQSEICIQWENRFSLKFIEIIKKIAVFPHEEGSWYYCIWFWKNPIRPIGLGLFEKKGFFQPLKPYLINNVEVKSVKLLITPICFPVVEMCMSLLWINHNWK